MTWLNKLLRKVFSIREHSDGDVVKPFLEHLEDLRVVIFKMLGSWAAGTILAYSFHAKIMLLLRVPLNEAAPNIELISTTLVGTFMISLKMSLYAGLVVSLPILLYFLAGFVLPALTRKEKKLILPGVLAGFVLFAIGVVIAYKFLLPKTIGFFVKYAEESGVTNRLDVSLYYSFVANLCIACGLLCELPVVIIGLSAINIVTFELLSRTRAYAITAILILVAIIAPSPDPFTFIVMGLPVVGIYEMCIWIVWLMERRRRKANVEN
jgi:sec-independent protein translocase protein TatC